MALTLPGVAGIYVGPFREVGVVICVALGALVLKERVTKRRMSGAALIAAGAVALPSSMLAHAAVALFLFIRRFALRGASEHAAAPTAALRTARAPERCDARNNAEAGNAGWLTNRNSAAKAQQPNRMVPPHRHTGCAKHRAMLVQGPVCGTERHQQSPGPPSSAAISC